MDPANNNPTPTEAPAAPASEAPAAPAATPAPGAPALGTPVPGAPAPATPAMPATPAVNPDVANAALNPPVNPVVAPTTPAAPGAAPVPPAPTAPGAPATMSMNQMFQSQPAAASGVFDETTAISVPEGPKPVDPVEEELKAPLKAAAPAPGSIGSAVSGPADANASQNNTPVDPNNPMTANVAPQVKKGSIFNKLMAKTKMNKTTLILLAAVAGLIVIGLIVVLVMVATGAL